MKKKIIYISAFASLLIIFAICYKNTNFISNQHINTEETNSVNETQYISNIIKSYNVSGDLAVNYEDLEKLIADAEIIVTGKISKVQGTLNTEGMICSILSLDDYTVLKGNVDYELQVFTPGGVVSAKEFYKFPDHEKTLRSKLSDAGYEAQFKSLTDEDLVSSSFMKVSVPSVGDQILLFLTFDEDISYFRFTGTPFFGMYRVNNAADTYERVIDETVVSSVSQAELFDKIEIIPDNSLKLKEQKLNEIPVEKDNTIEEKNPEYDKYKDNHS